MNKKNVNFWVTLFLSFCVVVGGWFVTKQLLRQRERELLGGAQQIALKQSEPSFIQETEENAPEEEAEGKGEFHGEPLSEETIEDILTVWESGGGYKIPCEPGEGQMTMEQAIDQGKEWIAALADQDILPASLAENDFDRIDAVLYSLDREVPVEIAKPYDWGVAVLPQPSVAAEGISEKKLLQYWEVTYTEGDSRMTLAIHAVSGQVWKANLVMEAGKMNSGGRSGDEILKIAFPDTGSVEVSLAWDNLTLYRSFPEGKVFVALRWSQIIMGEDQNRESLDMWLCTGLGESG